jgi:hypothetical protein
MNKNYYCYILASAIIAILGSGHVLIEFFSPLMIEKPYPEFYHSVTSFKLNIFGFTRSYEEFRKGFSLTMGVFMIAFGGFNFILSKQSFDTIQNHPILSLFNAILALLVFVLSILFFHWPPIIFFFIAFILYLWVYISIRYKLYSL